MSMNEGATEVGAIKAVLSLDRSDYVAGLKAAGVEADELARHSRKIQVEVNSAEIIAKLDAVAAAVTAMDRNQARLALNGNASLKTLEKAYTGLGDSAASGGKRAASGLDQMVLAARRVEDATARVTVAEQRLSEVRADSSKKQSAITAAENALNVARRAEQDAIFATYSGNLKLADSADKATKSSEKSAESAKKNAGGLGLLATSIITLGPALVPIAAGTAGIAAGFTGMGAAGMLAILGIKNEMKDGTAVGQAYTAALGTAKDDLTQLEKTAAANVLGPFQGTVAALNSSMPTLNAQISELSTVTGKAGANVVSGLLAGFTELRPVMQEVGVDAVGMSQDFRSMMSGQGMASFLSYVQSEVPVVINTVESLVTSAGHLVAAFAPFGGGVLTEVKALADGLNWLGDRSPGLLTATATSIGAVTIGVKAWQGLSQLAEGFGNGLQKVGFSAETAATGVRSLEIASGVIGVALAGLSVVMTAVSSNTQEAQAATDNLTTALINSNGAITDSVRLSALKNAQDAGAIDNARMLGISTNQIVDAYLGQGKALGDLSAQRDAALSKQQALVDAGKADASTMTDIETAYLNLKNQLAAADIQWDDSKVKVQQHTDVVNGNAGALDRASDANDRAAAKYGTTADVLAQAADAEQKMADKADVATQKMKDQNDAAGLLKQTLDALNGKALSNSEAQDAYAKARNSLGSQTKQAQDALAAAEKQKAGLSDGHTSAGGAASVASATAAHNQALEKQRILQSSGKATALQLASAQDAVVNTARRLSQAEANASKVTGAATQQQRDAADAAIAQAKAQIEASKAVDGNSDAALANRDKIRQMMEAGNKAVGTSGDLARSNKDARDKLIAVREDIIKTAASWGWNADQVRHYLDQVDVVPDSVPPTKFQADTEPAKKDTREWVGVINGVPTWRDTKFTASTAAGIASISHLMGVIDGVPKVVDVAFKVASQYVSLPNPANPVTAGNVNPLLMRSKGGDIPGFATGTLVGPGTGVSDSLLAMVADTGRLMRLSAGEFVSTDASRRRNRLALEAGNRGARLQVAPSPAAAPAPVPVGAGSSRMHPEDIDTLARALGREIRMMPTPQLGLNRFDRAYGDY